MPFYDRVSGRNLASRRSEGGQLMKRRSRKYCLMLAVVLASSTAAAQDLAPEGARTWADRTEEIEAFLKAAEVATLEEIGDGVTKPSKATLVPGGPAEAFTWKDIKPGIYRGHRESYKSEIAAYELDKLLEIGMTPPTVQRRLKQELGAAMLWVAPAETFKALGGPPKPPNLHISRWNWQLICAKMFHNLIYNKDPNLGNWLVDPAWNLIIIDNSRAFTAETDKRVHKLTRVDRDLWDRMVALDEAALQSTLGEWLGDKEIRAILERRDKMAEDIEEMVDELGERAVFVRWRAPTPAAAAPGPLSDESDEPAQAELSDLAGRLVDALHETPVTLPGTELTWIGRVVTLADYQGPDSDIAEAGATQGHTHGLVTEHDGLLCLTGDDQNPEHYTTVTSMAGSDAEVFGLVTDDNGLTVVHVTLCRKSP